MNISCFIVIASFFFVREIFFIPEFCVWHKVCYLFENICLGFCSNSCLIYQNSF